MIKTNKIIVLILLLAISCSNKVQNNDILLNQLSGEWKYAKHAWWRYSSYSKEQLDSIKASILHIDKSKIYFEKIKFIDTCFFGLNKIKINKLFDNENEEFHILEGPLSYIYTKEQLEKINKIDLGCGYGLSILYLKEDTLIINYCGGVTLFMTKANK